MSVQTVVQAKTFTTPVITPVSNSILQRVCACGKHRGNGGECEECKKKRQGTLQRSATNNSRVKDVPPIVHEVLRSPGQPLDAQTRDFMESRFGYEFSQMPITTRQAATAGLEVGPTNDRFEQEANRMAHQVMRRPSLEATAQSMLLDSFGFNHVRVHTDSRAAESADAVNALAYTVDNHIVFGTGQYAPTASHGKHLLAHELTHVLQQSGSGGTVFQRDLALEPTNLHPQVVNLTAGQIRQAINYNRRRYDAANTRLIQDVVGAPQTGIFDEETIRLIARYQDDFDLAPVDGKVGPDTFEQLTEELQAENVDDQTCLTLFNVTDPTDPLDIRVAGLGLADIFSRFNVTADFSPHCNCDEFEYRQFICGSVDRNQGGVVTNMNNVFSIPGGGLPQCPGWVEDGNTTEPQNGRYGHRNHAPRVNNRYLDDAGTVDMADGCRFDAFDAPGLFSVPANSGDQYNFDIRFIGDIYRSGQRMQRKFWAVRDNFTIP